MSDLKCNGVMNGHSSLVRNPYLADLNEDVLFHLQLSTETHDLKAMFHDVKVRFLRTVISSCVFGPISDGLCELIHLNFSTVRLHGWNCS